MKGNSNLTHWRHCYSAISRMLPVSVVIHSFIILKLKVSAAADKMANNEAILSMLECPVCYNYMMAPIYQCKNQHLICATCSPKYTKCPICRVKMIPQRSRCMEQISECISYPCKFESKGCKEFVPLRDKQQHEAECSKNDLYHCPLLGEEDDLCEWVGSDFEFEPHVLEKHRKSICNSNDGFFSLKIDVENLEDKLLSFQDRLFMCKIYKDALRMSVGPDVFNKVFTYFFHIEVITPALQDSYMYNVKASKPDHEFDGIVTNISDRINIRKASQKNECFHFMSAESLVAFEGQITKIE